MSTLIRVTGSNDTERTESLLVELSKRGHSSTGYEWHNGEPLYHGEPTADFFMRQGVYFEQGKTFGMIGRCPVKGCKSVHRFTVPGKQVTRGYRHRYTATVPDWNSLPYIECATHRRKIGFVQIEGRVTDHVCDARCTGATGHVCECSCGGKNHGMDFSV